MSPITETRQISRRVQRPVLSKRRRLSSVITTVVRIPIDTIWCATVMSVCLSIYLSVCLCLSIYLSIYGSTALVVLGHLFSFLILYTVGRTPCTGISPSQSGYLHPEQGNQKKTHRHPCLEWDSNPRFQFTTVRTLRSAQQYSTTKLRTAANTAPQWPALTCAEKVSSTVGKLKLSLCLTN
jgi:hypothetical protein